MNARVCAFTHTTHFSLLQALAIKSNPNHVLSSLNNLGYLMDDMWYYAGDRSTDVGTMCTLCVCVCVCVCACVLSIDQISRVTGIQRGYFWLACTPRQVRR